MKTKDREQERGKAEEDEDEEISIQNNNKEIDEEEILLSSSEEEEEEEKEQDDDESHLIKTMSQMSVTRSKKPRKKVANQHLQFSIPHISYVWEDKNRNKRFNVEFQVAGATDPSMFDMIVSPDGRVLTLVSRMLPCLVSNSTYDNSEQLDDIQDRIACSAARRNLVEDIKKAHGMTDGGPKKKIIIPFTFKVNLPFTCENPLNPPAQGKYRNTGMYWNEFPVKSSARGSRGRNAPRLIYHDMGGNRNDVKGIANVLTISLVSLEKNFLVKHITPKKVTSQLVGEDSDDDSDYEDSGDDDSRNYYNPSGSSRGSSHNNGGGGTTQMSGMSSL